MHSVEPGPDASRRHALRRLREEADTCWDLIVVGGGATGLGVALDGASRGFRVLLLEGSDFAAGTSSRSTKLLHGGVRYLAQGRIALVREALRERQLLLRNAAPAARALPLVIPAPGLGQRLWYGMGLRVYDALAGGRGIGASRWLDAAGMARMASGLIPELSNGGVLFQDGQFDDTELAIALAMAAGRHGALILNYVRVTGLVRSAAGSVTGVEAREVETGEAFRVSGRCVVNACGVWADVLRGQDQPEVRPLVAPSQGTHVVVPRRHYPGEAGILVPRTEDGRVLFILPWHGHLLLGTTDVALQRLPDAPGEGGLREAHPVRPTTAEVDFILQTAGRHLVSPPRRADILAAWSGVRPLLQAPEGQDGRTAGLSREHLVEVAASGLVTVTGGKWTTFRRMAADVLEKAARAGLLERRPGVTASLRLASEPLVPTSAPGVHGLDGSPEPDAATVRRLVREAFALTPEDVLARRYRWLFLDARAGQAMGRRVAEVMAEERGLDGSWVRDQCDHLASAAAALLPPFG